MPFVPKDLKNLLSGLRRAGAEVAPGRAARIGAQLLRAVAHLEAHGILHRDVKLDNVLLDDVGDELNERVVRRLLSDCTVSAMQLPGHTAGCQIPARASIGLALINTRCAGRC